MLPDLPVEHAVEQEDKEALDGGWRVRKEAWAVSAEMPAHRPGGRPRQPGLWLQKCRQGPLASPAGGAWAGQLACGAQEDPILATAFRPSGVPHSHH